MIHSQTRHKFSPTSTFRVETKLKQMTHEPRGEERAFNDKSFKDRIRLELLSLLDFIYRPHRARRSNAMLIRSGLSTAQVAGTLK